MGPMKNSQIFVMFSWKITVLAYRLWSLLHCKLSLHMSVVLDQNTSLQLFISTAVLLFPFFCSRLASNVLQAQAQRHFEGKNNCNMVMLNLSHAIIKRINKAIVALSIQSRVRVYKKSHHKDNTKVGKRHCKNMLYA